MNQRRARPGDLRTSIAKRARPKSAEGSSQQAANAPQKPASAKSQPRVWPSFAIRSAGYSANTTLHAATVWLLNVVRNVVKNVPPAAATTRYTRLQSDRA